LNSTWKESLQNKKFIFWIVIAGISLAALGLYVPYYFQHVILTKKGLLLHDIVLQQFTPSDWSWAVLALLYSALLFSLTSNYSKPWIILLGASTYGTTTVLRLLTMYLFTLEPPVGIIPLKDPFLSYLVYNAVDFNKDLFFSGHISAMCTLMYVESNKIRRWVILVMTLAMAILLVAQHVHYTIDVLFSPLITYFVFRWLRSFYAQKASAKLR